MALTNDQLRELAKEYGVPVTISNPPVLVKGEIMFLPGVKPKPTDTPPSGKRT